MKLNYGPLNLRGYDRYSYGRSPMHTKFKKQQIATTCLMTAFVPTLVPVSSRKSTRDGAYTSTFTPCLKSFIFAHTSQRASSPSTTLSPTCKFSYNIYQDSEDRSKRSVREGERAVTVRKPLGAVLEEGQDGMVFVSSIDKDGNAAMEDVRVGDVVVAVSATFGDEIWSTRGVGLDRVLKSIRIRSGDYVTLILESPDQLNARKIQAAKTAEERRIAARETFGEREVLNPVTWTSERSNIGADRLQDQTAQDDALTEELKEKLKNEVAAPYEQNWILWIAGGIFLLVVLSVVTGVLK